VRKPDFGQNIKNPQNQNIQYCIRVWRFSLAWIICLCLLHECFKWHLAVTFVEKSATLHYINLTFIPRDCDVHVAVVCHRTKRRPVNFDEFSMRLIIIPILLPIPCFIVWSSIKAWHPNGENRLSMLVFHCCNSEGNKCHIFSLCDGNVLKFHSW